MGETETVRANLRVEGLNKNYRSVKALDSVSFNAEGGKIVVLIGVNGAGKTTLLRIIAGLDKQEEGNILFNNQEADRQRTASGCHAGFPENHDVQQVSL